MRCLEAGSYSFRVYVGGHVTMWARLCLAITLRMVDNCYELTLVVEFGLRVAQGALRSRSGRRTSVRRPRVCASARARRSTRTSARRFTHMDRTDYYHIVSRRGSILVFVQTGPLHLLT